MGLICREIVLRWRSKKLEVGKVNSMRETLKYSGCGGSKNFVEGVLSFSGKGEGCWSGGERRT